MPYDYAIKIRIYPNKEQRTFLNMNFGWIRILKDKKITIINTVGTTEINASGDYVRPFTLTGIKAVVDESGIPLL